jgi:hypothetical protein
VSAVSLWPELAVLRGRAAVALHVEAFGARELYGVGGPDEHEAHRESLDPGTGRPQIG